MIARTIEFCLILKFLFDFAKYIDEILAPSKFQPQIIISFEIIARRKNKIKSADSQFKTREMQKQQQKVLIEHSLKYFWFALYKKSYSKIAFCYRHQVKHLFWRHFHMVRNRFHHKNVQFHEDIQVYLPWQFNKPPFF